MQITASCPTCSSLQTMEFLGAQSVCKCSGCAGDLLPHATPGFLENKSLTQCPLCGAAHLYRRKDFNQKLGIGLIVLGVALAYFTYGISLLLVTLIDFFLFKRIKEVGVCYQCGALFRQSSLIASLEPFNLQLFDYYRNLKEGRSSEET